MKIRSGIFALLLFGMLPFACNCGGTSSATTSTTTSTSGLSCGGEQIAKPGGGYWTCTFDDEFNQDNNTLDRSKWTVQLTSNSSYTTGEASAIACYVDTANNVSVANGYLNLTLRKESAPFTCNDPSGNFTTQYTAGDVSTIYDFSQTYGRFEISAKLPQISVPGVQETLWLWPEAQTYGGNEASGEIDFAEFYSEYPTLDIPYIHYPYQAATVNTTTNTNIVTAYNCTIDPTQFNTYAVVWEPGTITLSYNGNTCLVDNYLPSNVASPAPFNEPFFIVLTQAIGISTNAFNAATTPLPATMEIQYVRAWK